MQRSRLALIRNNVAELVTAIKSISVEYSNDRIDPALGVVVKREDLENFGFPRNGVLALCRAS
jgi:hypothetical protein